MRTPGTRSHDDNVGCSFSTIQLRLQVIRHLAAVDNQIGIRKILKLVSYCIVVALPRNTFWASTATQQHNTLPAPAYNAHYTEQRARKKGTLDDRALRTWYLVYMIQVRERAHSSSISVRVRVPLLLYTYVYRWESPKHIRYFVRVSHFHSIS